jgi:hypothetical protein
LLLEGRVSAKEKEKEENAVVLEETWTCRQRTKLEKERRAVEIDPSLKAKSEQETRAREAHLEQRATKETESGTSDPTSRGAVVGADSFESVRQGHLWLAA